MNYNYYVPYRHSFIEESGIVKPICITEILDEKKNVKEWALITKFNEKELDYDFPVGGLVLDFFNETFNYINNNKSKSNIEDDARRDMLDFIALFQNAIQNNNIIRIKTMISSFLNKDKDMEQASKQYPDCKVEIKRFGNPFCRDKIIGMEYDVYGDFMYAFVWIDAYHFLKNDNSELLICRHCNNAFIKTSKNQKYCPSCIRNRIPEKLKVKNNESISLRNKIYDRLNKRHGKQYRDLPDTDYGFSIHNHHDFATQAVEYKEHHTDKEYITWLNEIDQKTK